MRYFLVFSRRNGSFVASALLLFTALTMCADTLTRANTSPVEASLQAQEGQLSEFAEDAKSETSDFAPGKLAPTNEVIPQERRTPQTELITITSTGFEPAELTLPAQEFLLDVDNRSGIEEIELRLDRQDGGREKSVTVRSTAPEWRGAMNLRPGVYILSEANHPSWICRITITAEYERAQTTYSSPTNWDFIKKI